MLFDVSDTRSWENLFFSARKATATGQGGGEGASDTPEDDIDAPVVDAAAAETDGLIRTFEAPVTWVDPLAMDRAKHLLRFPPYGKRTVQYYCAKADFFAKNTNPQAMVMRIIMYLDLPRPP